MTVLLKLVLPPIDSSVDKAAVVRWYKAVGEEIGYGDPLLDVEVRRIKRMKRDLDPKKILKFRRNRGDSDDAYWTTDVEMLVRVVSADFGTLKRTCAQIGELLDPGDLLAVLATGEGETPDNLSEYEIAAAAEFRTTANILETP